MTKELLEKYLNNRCTTSEVDEVIGWMKQQSFFSESRELSKNDWQQLRDDDDFVSDEKLQLLLDKIHHKLNIEHPRVIALKRYSIINWISKAAAILLIPVLAFLFYTLSVNTKLANQIITVSVDSLEVVAPIGSRTVVELSDGSVVHLNYGSRMKYPQNFSGETRRVHLSGEGYFEVAHNPNKPFVVSAGQMEIKAVGTEFNVNAYPENIDIATTLVEGKVLLEKKVADHTSRQIGAMKPGQHVNFNINTGKIVSNTGNIDKYIAWKDGKMVFDNESIEGVAQRLSRMFNVDIQVENEAKEYKYTVTFVDEPLFQILELLTLATPISYKTLPRKKNPDGTFSKQMIIIEKKK
ncbi:MAG: DUF4974 domain-containing protein [Cyclobacteriaceae bacterium]|nr:DUF4974 domain-containing protein [Cyclobacteriaceae bacterium]